MSGALSSGIAALSHGASVSPWLTTNELLAPQYLNLKREEMQRNALLQQQDLDLKRLEYGLKLEDLQSGQAARAAAIASMGGGGGTSTASSGGTQPTFGGQSGVEMPPEYQAYYDEASKRTGIPASILIAQGRQESGFNPGATGSAGEVGLHQIKPSTATDPGFGVTGLRDPALLRDPRTNINFAADYLKARGGANVDWNDPAQAAAALRRYNGGGDPNYAEHVLRYVPTPNGGVAVAATTTPAAQPEATDLNGPRQLPPTGYNRGEVVTPASLANTPQRSGVAARTGGVDVAGPGAGQSTPATPPAAPAAPAAAPPAAPAAPGLTAPPTLTSRGLTVDQENAFRQRLANTRTGAQVDSVMADIERTREHNRDTQRQYDNELYKRQQDAANTARQTEADKRAQAAEERAAEKAKREEAAAAEAARKPFQGQAETAQNRNILITGDPKSPEYHAAYAAEATPKVGEGGLVIRPNMQPYRMPQDTEGNAVTTYDQPNISIGPGNLGELRKMETESAALRTALDDFATTAKKATLAEKAATLAGGSTDLRSAWTNAGLMAKGEALFNLGVLSGPDMAVIRGALADPSTFVGAATSSETIDKQVNRIKRLLETRIDQARRSYGGGMSTGGDKSKSEPAPAADRPSLDSFKR